MSQILANAKYKHNAIVSFYRESVCYTGWVNNVYSYAPDQYEYTILAMSPEQKVMYDVAEEVLFIAGDMEHEMDKMSLI